MKRIKSFLSEEKGSSEAVSSVVLIACAAVLLSAALLAYWGAFNSFFNMMKGWITGIPTPSSISST